MSSETSFVLIRRLADGTVEWIPLEVSPQRVPVVPNAAYTLVDRANYEAPQALEVQRVGENLVVEVEGTEVLALDGFFTNVDVTFYPTTNIAGGAGPFSGTPLTADSAVFASAAAAGQVVSSAGSDDRDDETGAHAEETGAGGTAAGGGSSPLLWVGVAAGGLGLAAAAGGGGGGSSGGGSGPPVADTIPPQITSGTTAVGIAENSGAGQVVYTATATDAGAITYSLRAGGDAAAFSINANTGAVSLAGNPDYETKSSYSFTVAATDAANNSAERAVTLAINNRDEVAPAITSGATATAINENSGAGQVVYTVTSTDTGDMATGSTTYSLKGGGDAAAFTTNTTTGAVTLTGNPDFETKSGYNFTVVATDAANNSTEQAVSLAINNLNDTGDLVTITSGTTAAPVDENSGPARVVYTVTATATGAVTYSLKPGGDAAAFTINANTGAVTLTGNPNFEAKSSYSFTVVATDPASNFDEQAVSLVINNRDEVAPVITSSATAAAINENSGAGQVIYTVTSTDTGDISTGSTTYSLKAGVGDAAAFTIDPTTGAVTLIANPNDETKGSYAFTVVATDAASRFDEQAVSLQINDLDEVPPNITSGATATAINENTAANQVVYTITSTDTEDINTGATTYSLAGADAGSFTVNGATGAVRLTGIPNYEGKSSYAFSVVATDAANNSAQRAVTLAINNRDEVPPNITSGGTAPAITENSGAGQVIYTVTSTDTDVVSGTTIYSKAGVDAAFVNVNPTTGVVTLIGDPDFETKSSYNFTVVATDGGGNFDTQAVSLAINDIADETPPEVDDVEITGAVGAQNGTLNAGDTVSVTVTMSEDTLVNTSGGTPSIGLNIGGNTVDAGYVSGSGTSNLIFQYTILPGDSDNNGISIPSGTLALNGGAMADAAGNAADLDHGSDGSNFDVDTTAPTLSSSTPDDDEFDVPTGDDIVLNFNDAMQAGSGNITISSTSDTRNFDVNGPQVSISGNQVTINPTFDLDFSTSYSVLIDGGALTDDAGNAFAGINNSNTLNFVTSEFMFGLGLTQGLSAESSRTFQSGASDGIDIWVAAADAMLSTEAWTGSANLGSDDRATLVGDDAAPTLAWQASDASADGSDVADSTPFGTSMPSPVVDDGGGQTHIMAFADMPAVMLTSQGLA